MNHWLARRDSKNWQATVEITDGYMGDTILVPVMCHVTKTMAHTFNGNCDALNFDFEHPVSLREAMDFCDKNQFSVNETAYVATINVYDRYDRQKEQWCLPDLVLLNYLVFPERLHMLVTSDYLKTIDSVYIR